MTRERVAKAAGVALTGWLLACSFPLPPGLEGMEGAGAAWMALIPLMLVARCSRPRAAFAWGWTGGMVFWLLSLSWLLALRHTWGSLFLPVLGWFALSAYCSLYIGLFSALWAAVPGPRGRPEAPGDVLARLLPVLAAPVLWAGTEMLRAVMFTGFPWNPLGASQYLNVATIQVATVGGVYAVSALVVLLNAALAMTILSICAGMYRQGPRRHRVHVELMTGLAVVALCWSWGVRTVRRAPLPSASATLRVAAVQPSIPQVAKWTEAYERDIHAALRGQTELALLSRPDLVVWPETTTPGMLRGDPVSRHLAESLASEGAWLLAGTMDYAPAGSGDVYLNGSFLFSPDGVLEAVYHKRHLVLFGEYLPFEEWFPFIKRWAPLGFSCRRGPSLQPLMRLTATEAGDPRHVAPVSFSVLICFEDVFPYLARRDVRRGARLLVNQTNNAWFEGSSASRQHMANAVLRAVENRVPLVRSANTGITCFVDRFGRLTERFVTDSGDSQARGFLVSAVTVPGETMNMTVYTRYGDLLFGLPCAFLTALGGMMPLCRRFRTGGQSAPESGSRPN